MIGVQFRMTVLHGVGFLGIGLLGIVIGGFVAWYIINKVEENNENEKKFFTKKEKKNKIR